MIVRAVTLVAQFKWQGFKRKPHSERQTNFNEELFLRVITLIFPARVPILDASCKRCEVALQQFLSSHFSLGGAGPNPRLILLFLHFVFEEACQYYASNPDKACREIEANGNDEYEAILKEHVFRGYRRLQESTRETLVQMTPKLRRPLKQLFGSIGSPRNAKGLSLDKIRVLTGWDGTQEELDVFVAFYRHIGLFIAENDGVKASGRQYSLPLIVSICEC